MKQPVGWLKKEKPVNTSSKREKVEETYVKTMKPVDDVLLSLERRRSLNRLGENDEEEKG
jgi:hypothetical protein